MSAATMSTAQVASTSKLAARAAPVSGARLVAGARVAPKSARLSVAVTVARTDLGERLPASFHPFPVAPRLPFRLLKRFPRGEGKEGGGGDKNHRYLFP